MLWERGKAAIGRAEPRTTAARGPLTWRVINKTGSTITAGPVQIVGEDAGTGLPKIGAASASSAGTTPAFGVIASDAADGAEADAVRLGKATVAKAVLNGAAGAAKDPVYLKDGGGLALSAGTVSQLVGVLLSSASNAEIWVDPQVVA